MSVWSYVVGALRGHPTPPPTEEEQRLTAAYQQALGKVREASAEIRGRSKNLDELRERLSSADDMMRDALGGPK